MSLYYTDDAVQLHHGDALNTLRTLPDESIDCCLSSPPYWRQRDYNTPGQYGLEATPAEYVATMRTVFAEVRRVLTKDGTCWINIGDSYIAKPAGNVRGVSDRSGLNGAQTSTTYRTRLTAGTGTKLDTTKAGLVEKTLAGIPARLQIALIDDGWINRNLIVWDQTTGPTQAKDRFGNHHETVLLLTKAGRYWFDLDPLRTATGANPGDVWTIPTQPFPGAHFATMPPRLAQKCILAGCRPGGVVLDPFAGSCTTGLVATRTGRKFIGIDLSANYLDLALHTRLAQSALIEPGGAA